MATSVDEIDAAVHADRSYSNELCFFLIVVKKVN